MITSAPYTYLNGSLSRAPDHMKRRALKIADTEFTKVKYESESIAGIV